MSISYEKIILDSNHSVLLNTRSVDIGNIMVGQTYVSMCSDDDYQRLMINERSNIVSSRQELECWCSKDGILHRKDGPAIYGKPSSMDVEDTSRRNTIANLLEGWGLLKVVDKTKSADPVAPMRLIKVIPFKEKGEWQLVSKYQIGKK